MLGEDGMWNIAVGDQLNRAVVVTELLLGDDVRLVAMYVAVDAHYATHNTRYSADVVRHHNNCHTLGEVV